ncbi:carbohydrate ABC transporter permease [Rhizobium johnstonii]|uniref:carbohydrate ABC transporter permease n=1 Tax=Rhizobium TaxID=379 RepID=UPI00102F3EA2|nr:carbohydrate ABC transporter permease [Rhizobium leguminosarum]TBF66924.1 carbohydrate ABC transporter permease [Rhizobium leguminosarum]TBF87238.1 carbohydrate ABC transporter permease [Rhizobium leguminosarum]TBG54924.1 carbohydrate ABC transporter permease [Rhizobium leguminosarum]TBG94619.1 carbohydrate ABC transporter permease [Rhizobium leguminosarum]TBG97206.1 carbohydrate ABC transporter permease [Rhizobium leguminosarum]
MSVRNREWPMALALTPALILILAPFVWLVISSFKTEAEIGQADPFTWPADLMWRNYLDAWRIGGFGDLVGNSLLNLIGVVVLSLITCAPAGYALAKIRFPGREWLFYAFILGLTVPVQAIVIPLYQVLFGLNLVNTLTGIVLVQVSNAIPFGIFLMRSFFVGVPDDLIEAAKIDGASHFQILIKVFLPISTPAVQALVIISALSTWNDFFLPLIVLISPEVQTLPLGLVRFASTYASDYRLVFSGTVISFLPIILLYILMQRRFTEGLTQGAIKG